MNVPQRQMTWDEAVAQMVVYRNERDALRAELEAAQKDAARYRWLQMYLTSKDMPILRGRGARPEPDETERVDEAIEAIGATK